MTDTAAMTDPDKKERRANATPAEREARTKKKSLRDLRARIRSLNTELKAAKAERARLTGESADQADDADA